MVDLCCQNMCFGVVPVSGCKCLLIFVIVRWSLNLLEFDRISGVIWRVGSGS